MESLIVALAAGALALVFAGFTAMRVLKAEAGNELMRSIGDSIREGAGAFLRREYMSLLPFVVVVTVVLGVLDYTIFDHGMAAPATAISYLAGTICSATAGFIGMNVAVRANVRTAAAGMKGLNPALRVAFSSGTVMGVSVVGIGLLGVTILYLIFQNISVVAGFGFGASSIALFARVGGGIFTKAADVGSDLVGKVEAGIPEDDPRNPGVIADNVGDNVGDVAGMGADLFESYVSSIISTVALSAAAVVFATDASGSFDYTDPQAVFPMLLAGAGIVAAILGTFGVRSGEQANFEKLLWSLRYGIFAAGGLLVIFAAILTITLTENWCWFGCVVAGLAAGTDYRAGDRILHLVQLQADAEGIRILADWRGDGDYQRHRHWHDEHADSGVLRLRGHTAGLLVRRILRRGAGGAWACSPPWESHWPPTPTGQWRTTRAGIAEQANLDPEVRERTDALDALGNTTAATGKGFAIGSAALTALALLAAYSVSAGLIEINEDGETGQRRWHQPVAAGDTGGLGHRGHAAVHFLRSHHAGRGRGRPKASSTRCAASSARFPA